MNLTYRGVDALLSASNGQLRPGLDPADVTPGLLGFLATLFMVLAVITLMRSMAARVRRVRYRALVSGTGGADTYGQSASGVLNRPAIGPAGDLASGGRTSSEAREKDE